MRNEIQRILRKFLWEGRTINLPAKDPVEKGNKGKKGNEGAGNVANKEDCLVTFLMIFVPIYGDIWL